MKQAWVRTRTFLLAGLLLLVGAANTSAQHHSEPPLSLSGTIDTGYYGTSLRNGTNTELKNPVAALKLDLNGYWHHPKFLTFSVRPQFSAGRQSSETVFPSGDGVSLTSTFLGGRAFPLTVSYTRLDRKLTTFGTTNRLAGLESDTAERNLNVNWNLNFPGLPQARLEFSKYANQYEPLQPLTSSSQNRARLFGVNVSDRRWGWDFDSRLHFEKSSNDLFNLFDPSQPPYLMRRNQKELRTTASHDFSRSVQLSLSGGKNVSDTSIQSTPFNQDYTYGTAVLSYSVSSRLSGTTRAGVTSNLLGYRMEQVLGGATGPSFGEGGLELIPLTTRLGLWNLTSQLNYALTKDLQLNGQFSFDSTSRPKGNGVAAPESQQATGQLGASYSHAFRRWQLGTRYAANLGRLEYAGLPSRSRGQQAQITASTGSVEHLELSGSAWASTQNVLDGISLHSRSGGAQLAAGRRLSQTWLLHGTYTYEQSAFDTLQSQYESSSHGLNLGVRSRWFDISGGRLGQSGLSFQPGFLGGLSSAEQAIVLGSGIPALLVVPSGMGFNHAALSFFPWRRFMARGTWTRNRQLIMGRPSNNVDHFIMEVSYQFRLLKLSAGHTQYSQSFGLGAYGRSLTYFLVSRDFRLF